MFFANLSLAEFLGLFALGGGLTVALYLLSRSRRRYTVSTLRFWQPALQAARKVQRRRIDQPWSLLLQLLALACLLLAIAQPRWGARDAGADHVLLLDTSAWMGSSTGPSTLLNETKAAALKWLRSVPAADRVLVVRADGVATPATRFESSRPRIEEAIRSAQASWSGLHLDQAIDFARQAQRLNASRPGEIVYIGAARAAGRSLPEPAVLPANLRVILTGKPLVDTGLTSVGLRRNQADPQVWDVHLTARNYGPRPVTMPVIAGFAGAPVHTRSLTLDPGAEVVDRFQFRARTAGWFEARLLSRDALASDDRVTLELPAAKPLRVAVYSDDPDALRPVLGADPRIAARYAPAAAYQPAPEADVILLDGFGPTAQPQRDSIWIAPPAAASPVRIKTTAAAATLTAWNASHVLGAGLHAKDLALGATLLFQPAPGDIVIAETAQGPAAVARPGKLRTAVLGFHPLRGALRFELSTPLLFANLFEWAAPGIFSDRDFQAGQVGDAQAELAPGTDPATVRVVDENGAVLPASANGASLHFFSAAPARIRVLAAGREQFYSLSLPEIGDKEWAPPPKVARGLAPPGSGAAAPKELWSWFAVLGALLLAAEFLLFGRRKPLDKLAVALKAAAAVCALAALLQPAWNVVETKLGVAILADTSASVAGPDLKHAADIAGSLAGARGRHWTRLLPFARATRPLDAAESAGTLRHTAGDAGRATDLERAVREAVATVPEGLLPRIALISDGVENRGSALRAAWQARHLGIPIDTFALAGRARPKLNLLAARLPATAFTGEKFPLELIVDSPARASATLEITAEGKRIGGGDVPLQPGENTVRVSAALASAGAVDLTATLQAPDLGELAFEQAINLRRPRVLYVTGDQPGMEKHLFQVLAAGQFDVASAAEIRTPRLEDYQMVVLNNWDLEGIAPQRKAALEAWVRQGGGLLVLGGENNIYREKKKDAPEDDLEKLLPAKLAPPRSPEGTVVVLIVDKSSSMEGRKIELARQAAIGVVENLRPIDSVGILIFDNSHQWAVPIRRAEDRNLIKRLVAGIMPDGGTQIAPALSEAFRGIRRAQGTYRHIVLLTDGISEEGDSINLAKEAAVERVTISTVGLGQDVNRAFLERVATFAKGKCYFLTDPSGLEQILLKDVMEHTGTTTVEKLAAVRVERRTELLAGVPIDQAPALKGYVRYQAKPTADTILGVDKEDPLLALWQYGLGRAAVFASDAKPRWAEAWISWPGFDRLWTNILRDLLPHAQAGEASVDYDAAEGELVVEYRLARHVSEPEKLPPVFALGPDNFRALVDVRKAAAGVYRGRVAIGGRQGLFRVRPLEDSQVFPEAGYYRPEAELAAYGNNELLLKQIAAYTGGRFNPRPAEVFDNQGRSLPGKLRLWPPLLALAVLLNLAELFRRKGSPLWAWLKERRAFPWNPSPSDPPRTTTASGAPA